MLLDTFVTWCQFDLDFSAEMNCVNHDSSKVRRWKQTESRIHQKANKRGAAPVCFLPQHQQPGEQRRRLRSWLQTIPWKVIWLMHIWVFMGS